MDMLGASCQDVRTQPRATAASMDSAIQRTFACTNAAGSAQQQGARERLPKNFVLSKELTARLEVQRSRFIELTKLLSGGCACAFVVVGTRVQVCHEKPGLTFLSLQELSSLVPNPTSCKYTCTGEQDPKDGRPQHSPSSTGGSPGKQPSMPALLQEYSLLKPVAEHFESFTASLREAWPSLKEMYATYSTSALHSASAGTEGTYEQEHCTQKLASPTWRTETKNITQSQRFEHADMLILGHQPGLFANIIIHATSNHHNDHCHVVPLPLPLPRGAPIINIIIITTIVRTSAPYNKARHSYMLPMLAAAEGLRATMFAVPGFKQELALAKHQVRQREEALLLTMLPEEEDAQRAAIVEEVLWKDGLDICRWAQQHVRAARGFTSILQSPAFIYEVHFNAHVFVLGCKGRVRAGAGGAEAALFAAQLLDLYERYARSKGWDFEVLEVSPADLGGFRTASAAVSGDGVFGRMRKSQVSLFESMLSGFHSIESMDSTKTAKLCLLTMLVTSNGFKESLVGVPDNGRAEAQLQRGMTHIQIVPRRLLHEAGVHRVQRVPATETMGRVHTSTASVVVLPDANQ
eukprot:scaffold25643_cov19-Tisochrysis_lutea.AAC.1